MGKKAKKHGKQRERHWQAGPEQGERVHKSVHVELPPQVAGIAAAALKQVNTPVFRQLVAGALGAAAQAFDQRGRAAAPTPPTPPAPPEPSAPPVPPTPPVPPVPPIPPEPQTAYAPRFEKAEVHLSPEAQEAIERVAHQAAEAIERAADSASRAIEAAAQGFERWVERKTRPAPPPGD
jgi:hypothetical protein